MLRWPVDRLVPAAGGDLISLIISVTDTVLVKPLEMAFVYAVPAEICTVPPQNRHYACFPVETHHGQRGKVNGRAGGRTSGVDNV
jgi:hypothetical protein